MLDSESRRKIREIANKIRATGIENWMFNRLVDELIACIENLITYKNGGGL